MRRVPNGERRGPREIVRQGCTLMPTQVATRPVQNEALKGIEGALNATKARVEKP